MISECLYRIRLIRLIVISESKVTIKLFRLSVRHVRCLGLSGTECPAPPTEGKKRGLLRLFYKR